MGLSLSNLKLPSFNYSAIKRTELLIHQTTGITMTLKWKKEKVHLYRSCTIWAHVCNILERTALWVVNQIGGSRGLGIMEAGEWLSRGTPREIFVVIRQFCILFVFMATQTSACDTVTQDKTHTLYIVSLLYGGHTMMEALGESREKVTGPVCTLFSTSCESTCMIWMFACSQNLICLSPWTHKVMLLEVRPLRGN